MFPINRKATFALWCALVLAASGQNSNPDEWDDFPPETAERLRKMSKSANSGDRLQADMAKRLMEMEKSGNRPDPHRPASPEMQAVKSSQIENLDAEDLAKMSLDDPLLKSAYASVFMDSIGAFKQLEPPQELALADMRRRGDVVSPMLLKLMSENYDNRIEFTILGGIKYLDTVRIEPFLEYARKLLRERLRSDAVAVASGLLAQRGTKEDIELIEWALTQRPFVVTDLTENIKRLRHRLDSPPPAPRPERREIPSSSVGSDARSAKGTVDQLEEAGSATSRTKPWFIGGLITLVLLGLYCLLRKGPRGNSA